MSTPLEEIQRQLGAHFYERDGVRVVRDYGDAQAEYHAVTDESGVIDLAHYSVKRVARQNRLAELDRLLKTDWATMSVGSGKSHSVQDVDGNHIADVIVLAKENELWLYSETGELEKLDDRIQRDSSDEMWTNASDSLTILSVQGAFASDTLGRSIGRVIALGDLNWGAMRFFDDELTIVKHARTGVDGFDILVPSEHAAILWEILTSNHARPVGLEALERACCEPGFSPDEI